MGKASEKIKEEFFAMIPPTIFFFFTLGLVAVVRMLMTAEAEGKELYRRHGPDTRCVFCRGQHRTTAKRDPVAVPGGGYR